MPVTPTLLLKLRETLGDEATTDLVTWVDDATAREMRQIREMAELHYSRFDARLEQRLAELKADLSGRTDAIRADLYGRIESLRADLYGRIESLRAEMSAQRAELVKWMFLFWVGTIIPLAGLMVAQLKL